MECAIWHDRAKGGEHNDYPATAVVARDRHGYMYALEVDLTREPASGQRARIWKLWERLRAARSIKVGCDDTAQTEVFAGESWDRERKDRQKAGRPSNLIIESHTLDEDKNVRISSLEPDTVNGWLQFASDLPAEVDDEFRDHPRAAHDDAADAIERACWLLRDSMPTINFPGRR
jgi:predicted phage terminase large subunit-like protein